MKPNSKLSSANRSLKQSSQKVSQSKYGSNKPSPTTRKEFVDLNKPKVKKPNQKENQCSPCALRIGFKKSLLYESLGNDNDNIKNSKVFNGKDKSNFKRRRNRDDRMKVIKNTGKVHLLYDHSLERIKDLKIQTDYQMSKHHAKISLTEAWNIEKEEANEEKGHINLRFKFIKPVGFRA